MAPINLNTVTVAELQMLEGIGSGRSNAIVNFREPRSHELRLESRSSESRLEQILTAQAEQISELTELVKRQMTVQGEQMAQVNDSLKALMALTMKNHESTHESNVNENNNVVETPTIPHSRSRMLPGGVPHEFFESRAPGGVYGNMATSPRTENHAHTENGPSAKMVTFDGKSDWKSFRLQFEELAASYHWTNDVKVRKLVECLRDKALVFYSGQQERVRRDYVQLRDRMERHFGKREPPATTRRRLHNIKQASDEPLEDFANKVYNMAQEGYSGASEDIMEIVAVEAFLKGCIDKPAALFAMNQNPTSIYSALDMVTMAIHNQRLLGGKYGSEMRRVAFEDATVEESASVRAVQQGPGIQLNNMKAEMAWLKKGMSENTKSISEILQLLKAKQFSRGRSPSPASRSLRCYRCSEPGHMMKECPNTSHDRSPANNRMFGEREEPLNL